MGITGKVFIDFKVGWVIFMSTEDYINEVLCSAVAEYASIYGNLTQKAVHKITSKLTTESVKAVFDKITYYQAVEAVNKVGRILNKDDEKQECVAVVNSGIWNMNIAFVALKSECDKTYVAAFAKEGIIKQHTAQKAIDYIFSAISDDN